MQILASWFSVAVSLSILVPWVVAHKQKQYDNFILTRTEEVLEKEALMRRSGLGLYGDDAEEILKEARIRVSERKSEKVESQEGA